MSSLLYLLDTVRGCCGFDKGGVHPCYAKDNPRQCDSKPSIKRGHTIKRELILLVIVMGMLNQTKPTLFAP